MKNALLIIIGLIAALLIGCDAPSKDTTPQTPLHNDGEESRSTTEVYKYDGSVQCDPESGISLDEMEAELTDEGIEIISSYRDSDGTYRIALCGAPTSRINVYEIYESDLELAKSLGFQSVDNLPGLDESEETSASE